MLSGKHIVLGVTGGVAIHRAVDLASQLVKQEAAVHVVMTHHATRMVTPFHFQTISRNPVATELFPAKIEWHPDHINLADQADLFAVVPATANIIAKIAHGIADDMLTTIAVAIGTRCPVLIAPAMNGHMYANLVVQQNLGVLRERGMFIAEPERGMLACGYEGQGRLQSVERLRDQIIRMLAMGQDLQGKQVVVTAGPTREALDPVRFLSNRSSGKMGYAIARAAAERGADVTLITGPTGLEPPPGIRCIDVQSAQEMYDQVQREVQGAEVLIMAAAVADYRPAVTASQKIKKGEGIFTLSLERNPDILQSLGPQTPGQIRVGFAAETEKHLENARAKLERKHLDMIVLNDVSRQDAGFEVDTNEVTIITREYEPLQLPLISKQEVAHRILDEVAKRF